MLHTIFMSNGIISILVVMVVGVAAILIVPGDQNKNSAVIFQSGPLGAAATLSVKQRDGMTIIERHDLNGNSAVIIQQK